MNSILLNMVAAAALATVSCSGLITRQDRSVSDLESELVVLKKRISMVEKNNALLESENIDQKSSIRRIKNDYAVLKNQSDTKIRELSEMNSRLKAEFLETTARLASTITGLEKKLAEKSEDLSKRDAALKELRAANDLLKTEITAGEGGIASRDKKIRELLSEIEKMKGGLEKNELLTQEREKSIGTLKNEIETLESLLKEKVSEISDLKSKLNSPEATKIIQK